MGDRFMFLELSLSVACEVIEYVDVLLGVVNIFTTRVLRECLQLVQHCVSLSSCTTANVITIRYRNICCTFNIWYFVCSCYDRCYSMFSSCYFLSSDVITVVIVSSTLVLLSPGAITAATSAVTSRPSVPTDLCPSAVTSARARTISSPTARPARQTRGTRTRKTGRTGVHLVAIRARRHLAGTAGSRKRAAVTERTASLDDG